jgi:SAM-dependent methyltransferase
VGTLAGVAVPVKQIDPPKRLSESLLWKLQERYFEASGIEAWSSHGLPVTETTSPALAWAYVQLIEALLEDCRSGRMGRYDPEQPLYVLDLGTGTGRLGFHLADMLRRPRASGARVVTVLTDFAEANLRFLSEHAKLGPLSEAGLVDLARYDVTQGGVVHLLHAGLDLVPGQLANPLVATANHLFGVLPQDLYCTTPAGLEEEHVEVYADGAEPGSEGWELADHIFLAGHPAPLPPGRPDGRAGAVLDAVAAGRSGPNQRFLFPQGALQAIDHLLELAAGRLLMLIADRDHPDLVPRSPAGGTWGAAGGGGGGEPVMVAEAQQVGAVRPGVAYPPGAFLRLASYGASFSLPVDLDAVAVAARLAGGELLRGAGSARRLVVAALVAGEGGAASSVRARFANSVLDVAPDDLGKVAAAAVAAATPKERDDGTLEVLLASLRAVGYDPVLFASCFNELAACLPPPDALLDETVRVLEQVDATNYWIRPQGDTAYAVATLVGRCGRYERAIELLDAARRSFGPRTTGYFNVAMCLLALGRSDEALAVIDDCLALDGSYEPARQLREKVLAGEVPPPEGPA